MIWQRRQSLKVVLCLLVVAGHSRKPVRIGMPRCLFRIKFLHALVGLDVYFILQMSQLVVLNVLDSNYRKISFSICYKRMVKYIVTIIIIMTRKGKYMVREDIEKAPTHDHPCNLTRCVYIHELVFFIFISVPSIFTNATITIKCYNFLSKFVYFYP